MKHSYIYNKYFKDYADANNNYVPEKKIPHTIEEYNQMVLEERIKNYEQRKRISFNDVLSNMNLVVNKNGVLQSMQTSRTTNDYQDSQSQYMEDQYNQKPPHHFTFDLLKLPIEVIFPPQSCFVAYPPIFIIFPKAPPNQLT